MSVDAQDPAVFQGVPREAVALLRTQRQDGAAAGQGAGRLAAARCATGPASIDVDEGKAEGLSSDEREELRRLRRELRTVTEEREILKKAAAFFAKESGTR